MIPFTDRRVIFVLTKFVIVFFVLFDLFGDLRATYWVHYRLFFIMCLLIALGHYFSTQLNFGK